MATQSDAFTRADSGNLGANWTDVSAGFSIASNAAYAAVGLESIAVWNSGVTNFTDDHFSEATASGIGGDVYVGVVVRGQGSWGGGTASGYAVISNNASADIRKFVNSSYTVLQPGLAAITNGQVVKLSVEGTTLRAYVAGAQVGTDEDISASPITGGQPGIFSYNGGGTLDNWTGEDIAGGGGGGGGTSNNLLLMGVG
jgi:hypothetical protein